MTPIESNRQQYLRGITIVGTGRLGTSLALRLYRKGFHLRSLYNRTVAACREVAMQTGTGIYGTFPEQLEDLGDLVFICLPDDQISGFAREAAEKLPLDDTAAWIHTSGATPAEALEPISRAGALTASFHPVQTFNNANRDKAFDGCFITLQGDAELCGTLEQLVHTIGARPLIVDKRQKLAVHLAAVMVCNYYAALFAGSQEVLQENGVDVHSRELFEPIVRQTIEGLLQYPPEEVLTGPVVRGDVGSIEKHLDLLKQLPQWDRLYRELGKATLSVARKVPGRDGSSDDTLEKKFKNDTE